MFCLGGRMSKCAPRFDEVHGLRDRLAFIVFRRFMEANEVDDRRLDAFEMRLSFFYYASVGLDRVVLIRVDTFRRVAALGGLLNFRFKFYSRCGPYDVRTLVLFNGYLDFHFIFNGRHFFNDE